MLVLLRQLSLGFAMTAVTFLGASPLALARVGAPYSLESLRPYLERGYTTRLGWEGWPITTEDPHLYLYDRQSLVRRAELEFGLINNSQIVSQTLRLTLAPGELSPFAQAEINGFLREASHNQLSINDLKPIFAQDCPGQWRLRGTWALSYLREATDLYLKLSQEEAPRAKPIHQCHQRKKK